MKKESFIIPLDTVDDYGYAFFILFVLTRPISLAFHKIPHILELYSIGFSYLFLIFALLKVKEIIIDRTTILITLFFFFGIASLLWGTKIKEFSKLILPVSYFFFIKLFIKDKVKIDSFYFLYKIAFLAPLILSFLFIILGLNVQMTEFYSAVKRHAGIYFGAHNLAYQMLFFSFIIGYEIFLTNKKNNQYLNIFMMLMSVYCLYQSHTRTSYIGFVLFWFIFLFKANKKYLFYLILSIITVFTLFSSQITNIFWKKTGEADLNVATSGRVELFQDYSEAYINFSLPEKIVGKGIGWKLEGRPGVHNDWVKLLVQTGIIGTLLYISVIISILYDIIRCPNGLIRYYFGAILITLSIMGAGSNVLMAFFELTVLFWLFVGLFYNFNESY